MKIIGFDDIASLRVSPKECCEWVDQALLMKSDVILPKKISLGIDGYDDVFYNTMPCIIPPIERAGVKLVTRYPHRAPALDSEILLYDLRTGEFLALMDADWITTMRTGAVAAHSIRLLAVKDFRRVAFIGLGNTARATLLCLLALFPDTYLEVGLLAYKDQHKKFEERFSDARNVKFMEFDDVSALATWSDVFVSCVTAAHQDLCSPDCFRPGSLLVPVHTRGFLACDFAFDKVFADDRGHVSGFKNFDAFEPKLAEVAEVLSGERPGRESDEERILAYNIGLGLHDVYFASKLFEAGSFREDVSMGKPTEKFWV